MDKAKKTLTDDFTYNTKGRFGFTRVKSIKFKRIVWRFIASKPYASQYGECRMLSKGSDWMKKTITALSIICILVIVIIALLYLFVLSGAFSILMPKPPEPQITYGEFPFSITYEVNGEIRVYEDSLICEYAGIESRGTAGKYRIWNSKLKSGNVNICLLKVADSELTYEISTSAGLPEYYMGDFQYGQDRYDYESVMHDERYLGYRELKNDEVINSYSIEKEKVFEKFKLRIIERKYSQPIENKFE